MDLARS